MNRLLRTRTARYAPEAPKLEPLFDLILKIHIETILHMFVFRLRQQTATDGRMRQATADERKWRD